MPRGLFRFDNGDAWVEQPEGSRLSLPRFEYEAAGVEPAYCELMTQVEFDEWSLGKRMGEAA